MVSGGGPSCSFFFFAFGYGLYTTIKRIAIKLIAGTKTS